MARNNSPSFFEKYASEYDAMTDAASREPKHRIEVDSLIKQFSPTSVLDAGCGTGLTTKLFAERGVAAVGIDSSTEMIRIAKEKNAHVAPLAKFQTAKFESVPKAFTKKFDLVVCLGNSISAIPSAIKLRYALGHFRRTLKLGGTIVVQMLNPVVIVRDETFGVRVTRCGDILYHRYATHPDKRIFLHIIRTDLSASPPAFEAFVHNYRLLSVVRLEMAFRAAGFARISRYPSLALEDKGKSAVPSRDLVIVAQRIS